MGKLTVIFKENDQIKRRDVSNWFLASSSPLYLGIITKPSPGLWEYMSHTRELVMEVEGKSYDFTIPYRIEVGESSIFFVTLSGGDSSALHALLK